MSTKGKRSRNKPQHPVNEVRAKVWFISHYGTQLGASIAHEVLKRGDIAVIGCLRGSGHKDIQLGKRLVQQYPNSCTVVELDPRIKALCQSSLATAVSKWGQIDILVTCPSKCFVGALEEVEPWHFREQLETCFYGPVNLITSVLPIMRKQSSGHIIAVSDVNGSFGTPSLSLLSSTMHALEGYLEALSFEIFPFNIKVTIVECPMEVTLLTNSSVFAKPLAEYNGSMAHHVRSILSQGTVFPDRSFNDAVHTVMSIGGIDNPPNKIMAGIEAMDQVKDKLHTLSEDVEDYLKLSYSVDMDRD